MVCFVDREACALGGDLCGDGVLHGPGGGVLMAVRFRGPLFDDPGRAIRAGAKNPLQELGSRIEATVKLNTPTDSGDLKRSVSGPIIWRDNRGVSIKSNLKERRKTWSERGTRRGVKLAQAYYMWRKGKSKAKEINKQSLMAADIARELNK